MKHWLMKTEPDVFSIDDLRKKTRAPWDGVRNFQARNNMRAMKTGDKILFYHSSTVPPGVAGLAQISREAFPDHTAWDKKSDYFDPRSRPEKPLWDMVEVEFLEKFPTLVTLDRLKEDAFFKDMPVTQRGSRLSVQPVDEKHFQKILTLGRKRPDKAGYSTAKIDAILTIRECAVKLPEESHDGCGTKADATRFFR